MAQTAQAPEVAYGGQAVIEGVMIRSPRYVSVACRLPSANGKPGVDTAIDIHTEPVRSLFTRQPWLKKLPLVRGFVALFEMLGIGLRSLERSASLQAAFLSLATGLLAVAEPEPAAPGKDHGSLNGPLMLVAIIPAFLIGIGIFVVLPNWLADVLGRWLGLPQHSLLLNGIEGVLRLLFFVAYVGLIGLMPDIRRVFQYHGAEHKVVNGFEAGVPLQVAAVQPMSVIHPRCGTNFAFLVIFLSLVAFSFLPWTTGLLPRVGMRLLLLPVVAGVGFELIKLVGQRRNNRCVLALIAPGLWLQRLTTREPSADMIEVALASFGAVRLAEETDTLTCERRGGQPETAGE